MKIAYKVICRPTWWDEEYDDKQYDENDSVYKQKSKVLNGMMI